MSSHNVHEHQLQQTSLHPFETGVESGVQPYVPSDGTSKSLLIKHGIRYTLVGSSSSALELILFFISYELLHFDIVVGNVLALTIAAMYNFTLSRKWTFKSASKLSRSITLYVLLVIWNQIFSSWAIVGLMNFGLPAMLAKLATMACIVLWNFVLYRKVVFK